MVYLRFQTDEINKKSGKPLGIFTLVHILLDGNVFLSDDILVVRNVLDWFQRNMPMPDKFSDDEDGKATGISWLKEDAKEMIEKFHMLKAMLERYDYKIGLVQTKEPGKVVYEDQYQVVCV